MEVTAHLNNLRIGPRKVRLIADLVRGLPLSEAVATLEFRAKRSARPLQKLILAAAADAEHNFKLKKDDLIVKQMLVNSAVTMKRFTPRAFGRATVIRKRGSRVTVMLVSKTGAKLEVAPSSLSVDKKTEYNKKEQGALPSTTATKKDVPGGVIKPKSPSSLRSRLFSRKTG